MGYVGFQATAKWAAAFPGALAATLAVRDLPNPTASEALDAAKQSLETELRTRWGAGGRDALRQDPVLAAYDAYYRRFGQNYHVRMQIESVALKGKAIPRRDAIVEAMFMAELDTGLLVAVHDLDRVTGLVEVIATTGEERYTRYDGVEESCKPGDMAMRDEISILTSVIQGPTTHARVTPESTAALFCLYAPAGVGVDAVEDCLEAIARNLRVVAPHASGFTTEFVRGDQTGG